MKNKKIKWVLAAFAPQLLMPLTVIALVCGVARNGRWFLNCTATPP